MRTEISELNKAIRDYKNPSNEAQWNKADTYLRRIHKKYGTTDPNFIQYLTR